MTTYDPAATLDAITANAVVVVVIGGLSIVAMLIFFLEAARMGARDRVYPMALWMTALWWPHDVSYLLHAPDWFGGRYDHWFMQLFWVAIVLTAIAETVYAWQTVRYGREEISPGRTQAVHTLRVLGAMAAGVISWTLLKGALDDPLYLISFMGTLLWGCPSFSALLMRRPDGRGTSVLATVAFAVMAVAYSIVSIAFFGGGFFHSWPYVGICLAACVWSLVVVRDVRRAGAVWSSWSARTPTTIERADAPATQA